MSRVITFYSYKGGVGRTFALANTAVLLAQAGKQVLVMDWDLEAPGLHRYFEERMTVKEAEGLIHLLGKWDGTALDWKSLTHRVDLATTGSVDIICSGDHRQDYASRVRSFSWTKFIEKDNGGDALERLRREVKKDYDFVLIDSRTGITDSGGICTVVLPDILVFVFGTNTQSFERGLDVIEGIQGARRNLGVQRPPLAILPLPGKFDGRDEVDDAADWLDKFSTSCKPIFDVWLPVENKPREILELTKIPYVAKFSFGEPLPVLSHGVSDPDGPGFYLNNVARLLLSDFADARRIIDPRQKFELTAKPLNEAKLMVLGNAGAGKTSLLSRLLSNSFEPATTITHGINIQVWQPFESLKESETNDIENRDSSLLRLNVWDFGGQEIYHATHRFFMTQRSLYLLVVDGRSETHEADYWLKTIQSLGQSSPVVVVSSKQDIARNRLDVVRIKEKYPFVVSVVETSSMTGYGIADLRSEISRALENLDSLEMMIPGRFASVKERIESMSGNCIDYSEFQDICRNEGLGEREQRALIGLLNDLGIVMYYADDPKLRESVVVNPQWIADSVHQVLDSGEIRRNLGMVSYETLRRLLKSRSEENDSKNHADFLVRIMRRFELCVEVDNSNEEFLFPNMLPMNRPEIGEWKNGLRFEYRYDVLPPDIISRFIVRVHDMIWERAYWRHGVVIVKEGNRALVVSDQYDSRINIEIVGNTAMRRDLLAIIRHQFARIHETQESLKV